MGNTIGHGFELVLVGGANIIDRRGINVDLWDNHTVFGPNRYVGRWVNNDILRLKRAG